MTFTCYIHKPGVLTPDLRIVSCDTERDLPDAIGSELPVWGDFEKVEVYDDKDRPVFAYARKHQAAH